MRDRPSFFKPFLGSEPIFPFSYSVHSKPLSPKDHHYYFVLEFLRLRGLVLDRFVGNKEDCNYLFNKVFWHFECLTAYNIGSVVDVEVEDAKLSTVEGHHLKSTTVLVREDDVLATGDDIQKVKEVVNSFIHKNKDDGVVVCDSICKVNVDGEFANLSVSNSFGSEDILVCVVGVAMRRLSLVGSVDLHDDTVWSSKKFPIATVSFNSKAVVKLVNSDLDEENLGDVKYDVCSSSTGYVGSVRAIYYWTGGIRFFMYCCLAAIGKFPHSPAQARELVREAILKRRNKMRFLANNIRRSPRLNRKVF